MRIRLVLLDIDGVLTDGTVTIDAEGNEYKTIAFPDIDAFFALKRQGYKTGLMTGEDTPITRYFETRFQPDYFFRACKDKAGALRSVLAETGLPAEAVCFVGDSRHDIAIMQMLRHTACPSNADERVKEIASIRLARAGGNGCVLELLDWLEAHNRHEPE